MAVTVRSGDARDLEACAALYERVVREVFTWIPTKQLTVGPFWDAAPNEELYVAERDGQLAGFASYYRPNGGFLHSLYIDREARGSGVGLALFNHVKAIAAGPLSLKVQKLNIAAIAFYERRGMTITESGDEDQPGGGWFRMREPA